MRTATYAFAWAALLAALATVLAGETPDPLAPALLFAAAAGAASVAALAFVWERRPPREQAVGPTSLSTALLTAGVIAAVAGAALGMWLVLIGSCIMIARRLRRLLNQVRILRPQSVGQFVRVIFPALAIAAAGIAPAGYDVAVDPNVLIADLVVAPAAPDWMLELVNAVSRRYGLQARVRRSDLDHEPV